MKTGIVPWKLCLSVPAPPRSSASLLTVSLDLLPRRAGNLRDERGTRPTKMLTYRFFCRRTSGPRRAARRETFLRSECQCFPCALEALPRLSKCPRSGGRPTRSPPPSQIQGDAATLKVKVTNIRRPSGLPVKYLGELAGLSGLSASAARYSNGRARFTPESSTIAKKDKQIYSLICLLLMDRFGFKFVPHKKNADPDSERLTW